MRGVSGALLLAPALTAAFIFPDVKAEVEEWNGDITSRSVNGNDRVVTVISVAVPNDIESPDVKIDIQFKLEVLRSEEACGFGNVTIDGQVLPQTLKSDVSSGKGMVSSIRQDAVSGSWSFYCINVNGIPDSQLMKFRIDAMGGETVEDVGFSVLFRQSSQVSIMNIEHDLSVPDEVVANPNPEAFQPADGMDFSIEEEFAALEYLWSQFNEIRYLIHEKESALAHHGYHHHAINLKDCDGLKCIVKVVADHARNVAYELYEKVRGKHDKEEFDIDHFGKKHIKHKGEMNHTRSPPKDCKGDRTLFSPWKKPHHRPLPICRYPPLRFHHGFPHGFPHGKLLGGPHECPHFGDQDRHQGPPDFDEPHRHDNQPDFEGHQHYQGPSDSGLDGFPPHHGEHEPSTPPPEFECDPGHMGPPPLSGEDDHPPYGGPPGSPHGSPPHFSRPGRPGPHRNGLSNGLKVVKFTTIGFLLAFLILIFHRRVCTPKRRADRRARREERARRRAYRRAAHKHIITRLLSKITGRDENNGGVDYEEKRERLLSDAEDGMSTTMTEDISEMRTTAEVADEMIIADSHVQSSTTPSVIIPTPISTPPTNTLSMSETAPLMHDFESGSRMGDGEEYRHMKILKEVK